MATSREVCTDCGGTTHEIKLVDVQEDGAQADAHYTLPEDKTSWWKGGRPIRGTIVAYMCEACGLIVHYGVPKE